MPTETDELRELLREYLNIPQCIPAIRAGDSIQEQYNQGQRSFLVLPDYDPMVDADGLVFNSEDPGPLNIHGLGPSVTELPPVLVDGYGHEAYTQPPTLSGFSVRGGQHGIRLQGAPFSTIRDVIVSTDGPGVVLDTDGAGNACNSVTLSNVQAYGNKGHGFLETRHAKAHSTRYNACRATANRGHGFIINSTNCQISGGDSQLNWGPGIRVNSPNASIDGVYVEGNSRSEDSPRVEVYGQGAHGLSVRDSYFHGIYPRGAEWTDGHVLRAINLHDSRSVSIEDCVYLRYEDAFLAFFGCDSPDVHASSHVELVDGSVGSFVSGAGQSGGFLSDGQPWSPE